MSDAPPAGSTVVLSRDGAVATVLIDRPTKKNAIDEATWRALPGVAAKIAADPEIAVVVLRGAGGVFSAGADIGEFVALASAAEERRRSYADAVRDGEEAIARIVQPTIAAIEGPCVGGGCQIALACDLRIAAEGARFGVTPAKLGIVYPVTSTRRLMAAVGAPAAKRLIFTGALVEADEALAIGLVDQVVETAALETAIRSLAGVIAENSRYSLSAAKRTIDALAGGAPDVAELDALWRGGFSGEDLAEGARAFLDKRPPRFTWRTSRN